MFLRVRPLLLVFARSCLAASGLTLDCPGLTPTALSFGLMNNQPAKLNASDILSYEQAVIISPYFLVSFCL